MIALYAFLFTVFWLCVAAAVGLWLVAHLFAIFRDFLDWLFPTFPDQSDD